MERNHNQDTQDIVDTEVLREPMELEERSDASFCHKEWGLQIDLI